MTADPLAALPDPAGMSDVELQTEVAALIDADAASARRWACDRQDCDDPPHEGWLHHHARGSQVTPESEWTSWLLLTGRDWGKILAVNTLIPTPGGWKKNGELRVGDQVFDEFGRPCTMMAVFDAVPDCAYRLHFSDGTTIDACADHQWVTWDSAARKALNRSAGTDGQFPEDWPSWRAPGRWGNGRSDGRGPRVVTTQEIVDTITVGKRGDTNHAVPTCRPLELPEAELPVDSYLFGVWLGDGDSRQAIITSADEEIPAAFEAAGHPVLQVEHRKGFCPRWSISGLLPRLQALGVLANKHVPSVYLRASRQQRMDLLAGLMDAVP
ncbi:hypothetical protein ACQEVY_18680 [Streptomyces sp. CA-288835]|uniref:hypothetical protein n=1 Tax=Streptomyces sp. CA-288835 TaxID=3240069 RepID=UPI003D916382